MEVRSAVIDINIVAAIDMTCRILKKERKSVGSHQWSNMLGDVAGPLKAQWLPQQHVIWQRPGKSSYDKNQI